MSVEAVAGAAQPANGAAVAARPARVDSVCCGLMLAGVALYTAVFSVLCCRQFDRLAHSGFDLSIFSQAGWLISHGETPFSTIRGTHLLADHFSAILYLLAPLCWIWNSPKVLLVAQTAALGLGAVPVYGLALKVVRSAPIALLFAISYLLNPSVQGYSVKEFHPDSFVTPLLLGAFYFLHASRWRGFFACLALAALTKETVGLVIVPLGVYAAFFDRRKGALAILLGLVALVVALGTMRHFSGGKSSPYTADLYGQYGHTPAEVVWAVATRPGSLVRAAASENGRTYLFELAEPLAYFPLLAPEAAAVSIPSVAANLLGRRPSFREADMWYSAPITPVVFAAAIIGFARCYRWRIKVVTWMLLANLCAATLLATVNGPLAAWHRRGMYALTARQASDARLVLAHIPPDASVSAQTVLLPSLSERKQAYVFPNPFYRSCWGLTVDALTQQEGEGFAEWPAGKYERAMSSATVELVVLGPQPYMPIPQHIYDALLAALLECPRYGIVEIRGEYMLLQRGADRSGGLRILERASGLAVHTHADIINAYWLSRNRAANTSIPTEGGTVE